MDFSEIGNSISEVAPILSAVISTASPPAGLIISLIAKAVGAKEGDTKDILDKIKSKPDAMEAIKRIESDHQNLVADDMKDKQSARDREIKITEATQKKDSTMQIIIGIIVLSSAILLGVLIWVPLSHGTQGIVKDILANLVQGFLKIVDYYY